MFHVGIVEGLSLLCNLGEVAGGVAVLRILVKAPTKRGVGWDGISIDDMCLSRCRYRHSVDGKPILCSSTLINSGDNKYRIDRGESLMLDR